MSGGAYDYKYCSLAVYEGELEDAKLEELLQDVRELLHDLEWYKSGDTDRNDYLDTVNEFKRKWNIDE